MEDKKRHTISVNSESNSDYLYRDSFLDSLSEEELNDYLNVLSDSERIMFEGE